MEKEFKNAANLVKDFREKTGLNKRQFSRKMGCSDTLVSKIEKGERMPTKKIIEAIANMAYIHPISIIYDITEKEVLLLDKFKEQLKKQIEDNKLSLEGIIRELNKDSEIQLTIIGIELQQKLIDNN